MLKFLPQAVQDGLAFLNRNYLYEIRLRADRPTMVNYKGVYQYLSSHGITDKADKAIRPTRDMIADCVFRAGRYSIYAVEEQIKRGFVTAGNGERIGIAGEYVYERGEPIAIRNFTSLCIRVPHEVLGCGQTFYELCMSDILRNVLLLSAPGLGKTTILRDVARILSKETKKNVLLCDERGELSVGDFGDTCDTLKYADKATAFEAGIRALRPDVLITDELSEADCSAVQKAVYSGTYVLASVHVANIERLKPPFFPLFDRYVVLDDRKIGRIKAVYDGEKRLLYDMESTKSGHEDD